MHLKTDVDILSFIRALKQCTGDVLFCTKEGDVLNLKSQLSQYIFASLTLRRDILTSASIVLKEEADQNTLAGFLTE